MLYWKHFGGIYTSCIYNYEKKIAIQPLECIQDVTWTNLNASSCSSYILYINFTPLTHFNVNVSPVIHYEQSWMIDDSNNTSVYMNKQLSILYFVQILLSQGDVVGSSKSTLKSQLHWRFFKSAWMDMYCERWYTNNWISTGL